MRDPREDDVSWSSVPTGSGRAPAGVQRPAPASSALQTLGLVGGFVLVLAAVLAVFLTDDVRYLRIAVLAVAWAFVVAAVLAGRRRADRLAAAGREEELRRSYERELDRAAAVHRGTGESVRSELAALRAEVCELGLLRHEVARLARLGTDLPELSGLRAEVAGLAGLRDDVAALASRRADLAQLAELRADVGRLRTELAEQFNGEMLVERILLRSQATRMPAAASSAVSSVEATPAAPTPLEELADRSPVEPADSGERRPVRLPGDAFPPLPPRRRRTDEPLDGRTQERRAADAEPGRPGPMPRRSPHPPMSRQGEPAATAGDGSDTAGHQRLAEILAEGAARPTPGSGRRRRYRDEVEDADDVLARVLGRS